MRLLRAVLPLGLTVVLLAPPALSQGTASGDTRAATAAFERARSEGPLALRAFLLQMPKGADLHMHLSGAVYAETLLRDAAADLLCVEPVHGALAANVGTSRSLPPQPVCAERTAPVASAFVDQPLYDRLIDAFSMRDFVPSAGVSAHDQFFTTFDRFHGLAKRHAGEWLDEVATRAAAENVQALEVMETPPFAHAAELGATLGWPGGPDPPVTTADRSASLPIGGTEPAELQALREKLLAAGLRDEVATDRAFFAEALAARRTLEGCAAAAPKPACTVDIRFLYQVLRAAPPERVFAQLLLAFETAAAAPELVAGINLVQPEDAYLSLREYTRQMRMIGFLHGVYPSVHIALHAGELTEGLVPPAALRSHIREAVELAGAERIGHGVDVMGERDAAGLLGELRTRGVLVEINLTSNDVILGVTGRDHPLPFYMRAGVPVALASDDAGVSRIDLTHEYVRAVLDFGLSYGELKAIARDSIRLSFLPGGSLASGEKAEAERELERRFNTFEAGLRANYGPAAPTRGGRFGRLGAVPPHASSRP